MESKNKKELLDTIIAKAWEDPAFKAELIANPHKAIEKAWGRTIPLKERHKILVTDQSDPNTLYINIPVNEDDMDIELSDDQLDQASGGTGTIDIWKWLSNGGN